MKTIHLLISLLFCAILSQTCYSKENKVDSLLRALKSSKEDTGKVTLLNNLGWILHNHKPDTAILLFNQALTISEKKHWKKGISRTYHNLGSANLAKGDYERSLDYFNKALAIRVETKDTIGQYGTLQNIGNLYKAQDNYFKALSYMFEALKLEMHLPDKRPIAFTLGNIGRTYFDQCNYPKAIEYHLMALKIREALGDIQESVLELHGLANAYQTQGDYVKALEVLFKELKICEDLGFEKGISFSLGNIGSLYSDQGDYSKALHYYFLSLKHFEALKPGDLIATESRMSPALINIGDVYYSKKNYPKALEYYFLSLKKSQETGNKEYEATILLSIGGVYANQGDSSSAKGNKSFAKSTKYPMAMDCYLKSLKLQEEFNNQRVIANTFIKLGSLYTKTGNHQEAEYYLKRAIKLSDSLGTLYDLQNAEELISDFYSGTNQFRLSLEHYKKAMVYKDTLFGQEKNKEITRKEMNYEFKKKEEATKAEQAIKDAVTQQQIQKQRVLKSSFMAGFAGIILLAVFVYNNFRVRNKLKLQTLRNKIASDLHDDVGSTLSSIAIFTDIAKQQSSEVTPMLEQIGDSSRKMLDAMADIVWTIHPENDQFEKIILRMRSFAYELLGARKIDFEFDTDEFATRMNLSMDVRKNLYLIFKEATNNIVKYAEADKASFSIKGEKNNLIMLIRDNGKGFDVQKDTQGNGLKNMKRRAEEIGARLLIESEPGSGTTIQFLLNLA